MLLPFEQKKRKIIIKKKVSSNSKFGCSPDKRSAEVLINYGVVCLNKPEGPTSHQVSDFVKKILKIGKAGHSGTLDPGVVGVLPVAVGDATKVVQALLSYGKEYVCLMKIHKQVDAEEIRKMLKSFVGKIKQLPPVKSAVKREIREKEIYYIEIIELSGQNVLFRIGCQAGTYIRKLCHDIGVKLGVGAHMQELVRTKAGPFKLKDCVTLQDLTDAYWYYKNKGSEKYLRHCIRPVEEAVSHLPKIWVVDSSIDSICHGAKLAIPGIAKFESEIKVGELVAVMSLKNELVCLGTARMNSEDIEKKDGGIVVKTERVFMKIGLYPKI